MPQKSSYAYYLEYFYKNERKTTTPTFGAPSREGKLMDGFTSVMNIIIVNLSTQ